MNWNVGVIYPARFYFESDLESEIHMEAGVDCEGSGMGFGERDILFSYDTKEAAEDAAARIEALNPEIVVDIFEEELV